ncbi:MAG TPA: LemA family protein [Bryobacteraceae bacterium]|nr:LemA family protein [Bryobacteraceae bacterium]
MKRILLPAALVVVFGIAAGSEFVSVRRNLSNQRAVIDSQWDELSDALEDRAELVANLAGMIQRVENPHDSAVEDATESSKKLKDAQAREEKIAANARLMTAFARLYLEAERRPKLTESPEYKRLNEEIGGAESRVAVERRKYNDLLEHYNAQLQRFPQNIVAGLSGLSRIDAYVQTEQEIR